MVRLIDLTVKIRHRSRSEPIPAKIEYINHVDGAKRLGMPFQVNANEFPDGFGLSMENIWISTHCGTHLDAPYHFGPTSEGNKSKTIDEIPLEWCYGDGVVLDFSTKPNGAKITEGDIKEALKKINYTIKPFNIVLIRTDRDKFFDKKSTYSSMHPGMTRDATLYLINQGVKIIGTDGYGFDRPFELMFKDYKKTGNNQELWPAHFVGREREYLHIEKLANLDKLPAYGFKICAFPIPIVGASAGWVRVVAIIPD
ncbi:MAG: cyclase family protein [Candidatus Helarchaeota archaeon]